MPIDKKYLNDLSNRLTQRLQTTSTESTTVSPQWVSNYANTRDAQKLESLGNQINKITGKPNKYSETWLQSTGQSIPGLDSEGTSAMNALDLIGLPGVVKIAGAIGREGIKRGIGRVATNLIDTSAQNISSSLSGVKFKDAIKAIIKDKPIKLPTEDEVPYRMMFGLKPRNFAKSHEAGLADDAYYSFNNVYAKNPDGSLRFKSNTYNYDDIKARMETRNDRMKEFVLGHYKADYKTGKYWDKWDVGLNPGELKTNFNAIKDLKSIEDIYKMDSRAYGSYNSVPTFKPDKVINSVGEIDKFKLATEKTKAILRLLERAAVRKTVDMFTDPVVIQGTIKGIRK